MNDDTVAPKRIVTVAFISHASADAAKAQAICKQLETSGLPCWIAPRDLRDGHPYPEEIINGIESSQCLVLVLSQTSNKSRPVRDEVERAWSKGKPLYPIRIDDVLPSRSLELLISSSHWTDARQEDFQKPIQKLAAQLANNEDVIVNLPPGLRRQIKLRRYLRSGAFVGMIVAVAAVVGLVMRITLPQPAQETFTKPPGIAFFGSLVGPQFPLETKVLIQSGYDQDGMLDIFKSPVSFSLFDVGGSRPQLIYRSLPNQFGGAFQAASTFPVKLPTVPLRVVACLAYTTPKTQTKTALLIGYTFNSPKSSTETFPIDKAGPEDVRAPADPEDCPALAGDYAKQQLARFPSLDTRQAVRARAIPLEARCSQSNNSAALACTVPASNLGSGAAEILAGSQADDLRFRVPLEQLPPNQPFRFALPALANTMFAAVIYGDGSRTEPVSLLVQNSMNSVFGPPPMEVKPEEGQGPSLFIGHFPKDASPSWGLAVAASPTTVSASWSRDGQGGTPMTKAGSLFLATVSPPDFGIASPAPPPAQQLRPMWIILRDADGKETTVRYSVDLWQKARTDLRAVLPPENMLQCTESELWNKGTQGAVKVICRFINTAAYLLSNVEVGMRADTLRQFDVVQSLGDIDQFLAARGVAEADRNRVRLWLQPDHYPNSQNLTDWRKCGRIPGEHMPCFGPSFVETETTTTIYARLTYWDGQETGIIKLPVK